MSSYRRNFMTVIKSHYYKQTPIGLLHAYNVFLVALPASLFGVRMCFGYMANLIKMCALLQLLRERSWLTLFLNSVELAHASQTYTHKTILIIQQGSSEIDGRSNVYDRLEFKVISNCCYNNCCRTNCSHFTGIYLNLPDLPEFSKINLDLPEFTWIYLNCYKFTWIYMNLPEFTWISLNFPKFSYIYLNLPMFTWIYLNLPELT